ncbi:Hypothetical predicted protein [Lecanosticta acicola]|uniref:DUF300-domain-containing protein n=1 Tax=Lecanosticta acicola TaxID=111012 RepID=A0AAI8Z2Y6_9PEZI|nr:Hypothetical predicted protein [Lecanosticta acicola]
MGNSSGDKSCPIPDEANEFKGDGSSHTVMLWIAAIATAVTLAICVSLIFAHLRRYRCPKEQRQIIRITFAPFIFALVCFFEILSYDIAPYIDPLGDLYEAFGLCALFLLYIQFCVPGGTFDEQTFDAVKASDEGTKASFDWPRITWIFVFQYPIVEVLSIVILEATEAAGTYCVRSLNPKYGHLWEMIISSIGVGAAVLAILRFYGRMKNRMKVRRGLSKLVCFKLIVGIRFLQSTIFSILLGHDIVKPSSTFSYDDLLYGLPSLLTCCEMVFLSLGFWYAYSSTEYGSSQKPTHTRLPVWRAVLDAINPWDLMAGIGRMFGIILHLSRTGGFQAWGQARAQAETDKRAGKAQARRAQGRYQTIDGMESLSRPDAAHGTQFENPLYPMVGQPPPDSPPRYDDPTQAHLMPDSRKARSPSPSGRVWDGQRYDRTPSPSGRYVDTRDMV